ncbi:MAG: ABC transporter permease [Anaerolineae bacterium]|nr:ABC transporter permease [Anaerolineae bacterium]
MAETKTSKEVTFTDAEKWGVRQHRSLWGDAWQRLTSSNAARLGLVIVVLFVLSTVLAHFFWDYDPRIDLDYSLKLKPPNLAPSEEIPSIHPFGTDKLGRDIFRRVIHGGWNSMRVGVVAVGISLTIGGILGLLAGFYESMSLGRAGLLILFGGIGLVLGALSAWIAGQPFQALLFCVLGVAAVLIEDPRASGEVRHVTLIRVLLFAGAGLLLGGGPALFVSPYTAAACALVGLIIGGVVALPLSGSFVSNLIMRVMDVILAFPAYLLAIAILAFLGPGLDRAMIAIGFVAIPTYTRLLRSTVLSLTQETYVLAAQSIGTGHGRIIFRHILPNTLSPIIVQATMGLASAILWAGALGFLGLGAIPPEPEWGAMLGDSYRYLTSGAWWAVLFPGLAIMLSVLGFNLLGDGLRDALDPHLTR